MYILKTLNFLDFSSFVGATNFLDE